MIVVVADDFTGAAEIGGVGLRYGLKAVIATHVEDAGEADLLIIPTDTRAMSAVEAARVTKEITGQILKLKPEFIFKKLDSALRGNIAVEIDAELSIRGMQRAILVPGNPELGRIIRNGHYTINGVPLHQTFFADTPDFPEGSSSVVDIISRGGIQVVSCTNPDDSPEKGIIVGDVTGQDDLSAWAGMVDKDCLFAGGAGFFHFKLAQFLSRQGSVETVPFYLGEKSLFVLGSLYPRSEKMLSKLNGKGLNQMNMPEDIYRNRKFPPILLDQWANEIIQRMKQTDKVVISIDHKSHDEPGLSKRIRLNIGQLLSKIIGQMDLDNLLIEGGATTFEILKNLNINKLYPFRELGLGIIQMKADAYPGLGITTKPGSYDWPDNIEFENKEKGSQIT